MILHPVISEISTRRDRVAEAVAKGHLTPDVSRYMHPGWAHILKFDGNPSLAFPSIGNFDGADEESGAISYVVTTDEEDRDGDIVRPMGAHLKNYRDNPIVFFGHQEKPIPIGVCRSPDGTITVYPENHRMVAAIYFDRADPDADFIYGKCQRKILNATSIAFVPVEAWRRDDIQKARSSTQSSAGAPPGWYFNQWDFTELSVVGVPSNPKAVGLEKDLQGACRDVFDREKSFMSMNLQKAWQPYVAEAKGSWAGWDSAPVEKATDSDIGGAGKVVVDGKSPNITVYYSVSGLGPRSAKQIGMRLFKGESEALAYARQLSAKYQVSVEERKGSAEEPDEEEITKEMTAVIRQESHPTAPSLQVYAAYDEDGFDLKLRRKTREELVQELRRFGYTVKSAGEDQPMSDEELRKNLGEALIKVQEQQHLIEKLQSTKKSQMLIVNATEFDLSEASSSSRGHPVSVADGASLAPLGASDGPPKNNEITFQGRRYYAKPRDGNSSWRVLVPKSVKSQSSGEEKAPPSDDELEVEKTSSFPDWNQAHAEAQKLANQTGLNVAIRRVREYGKEKFNVNFASGNDSDYARAEIVKPNKSQKAQPSDDIDPDKACKTLSDGQIDGVPLTDEQRGMFGAACAKAQKSWGGLRDTCKALVRKEDDDSWVDDPKVGDRVKTPMGNGVIQRVRIGPTLQNEVRLDNGQVVMLSTSRLEYAKAATQADLDSPGVPGRNANPPGSAEQEKVAEEVLDGYKVGQSVKIWPQGARGGKKPWTGTVAGKDSLGNLTVQPDGGGIPQSVPLAWIGKSDVKAVRKSYKVIQESSNGYPMTTEDYDLPGPAKLVYLVVNEQGYPVNANGQVDESSGREGYSYWTSQAAANSVAQKLNSKKSQKKALPRSSAYGVRISSASGKWEVYHHARGPVAGPFNTREEAEAEALRLHERESKKAIGESEGRIGGYLVPQTTIQDNEAAVKPPQSPTPEGWAACETCHGDGNCGACGGIGEDCDECGGSGECGACAGEGHVEKSLVRRKVPAGTLKVGDKVGPNQYNIGTVTQISPDGKKVTVRFDDGTEIERHPTDLPYKKSAKRKQLDSAVEDNPQLSTPQVLAALYSHAKAEAAYLDQLDDTLKDTLGDYRRQQLDERMASLKAMFRTTERDDDDLEKLCKEFEEGVDNKGFESTGPDSVVEPGEAGLVEQGEIPDTELTDEDTMKQNTEDDPETKAELDEDSAPFDKAAPGTEEWAEEEIQEPEHKGSGNYKLDRRTNGWYVVEDGGTVAGPFPEKAQAADWIRDKGGKVSPEWKSVDDEETIVEEKAGGVCMCGMDVPEGATECPGCGAEVKAVDDEETEEKQDEVPVEMAMEEGVETPVDDIPKDSDPTTEEILERYRQPKSNKWATRKWLVNKSLLPFLKYRVAANGQKYLVRAKQQIRSKDRVMTPDGPGVVVEVEHAGIGTEFITVKLDNGKTQEYGGSAVNLKGGVPSLDDSEIKSLTTKLATAIDDLKSLFKAPDLPKHYRAGLKHVADQLWYVGKALTDKGKEQKNGGSGSELSDKGKEQKTGGKGSELSDKGEQQGKTPTKSNGRKVSSMVERKLQETLAKLRRHGVLNGR